MVRYDDSSYTQTLPTTKTMLFIPSGAKSLGRSMKGFRETGAFDGSVVSWVFMTFTEPSKMRWDSVRKIRESSKAILREIQVGEI